MYFQLNVYKVVYFGLTSDQTNSIEENMLDKTNKIT